MLAIWVERSLDQLARGEVPDCDELAVEIERVTTAALTWSY
jgi:hypothetical protein